MSQANRVKLAHLVRFGNGQDWKEVAAPDGDFPVYGSGGEFGRASDFLYDGDAILFGRKGTVDRPIYVDEKFWTVDTMYYAVPNKDKCLGKYLFYWATTIPFATITTNTALPSVTAMDLSQLYVPLPPLETQRRIADYLDRETTEIDAAVADLDKYVELLEKRRRAKITFAVEGKSNLVKDNSTESHPVANLGLVAHAYQPETLSMEALNQSGTFPVFGANGIIGRHDNFNHEQPQVVIACRGNTCGAVNRTLPKSWINGNAMVINPYAEKLRKDFLFYVLEIADYSLVITGSAQPQIIRESLYRLRVPLPPLETQQRIADYLDRETTEIDALIAESTTLRDLLLKRRSVLIPEVVTGRKQV